MKRLRGRSALALVLLTAACSHSGQAAVLRAEGYTLRSHTDQGARCYTISPPAAQLSDLNVCLDSTFNTIQLDPLNAGERVILGGAVSEGVVKLKVSDGTIVRPSHGYVLFGAPRQELDVDAVDGSGTVVRTVHVNVAP